MLRCGLLGERLGHSWSPDIHAMLGDYEYKLYERAPHELEEFLERGAWDGLNVTMPYKKAVIPYCAGLSPLAERIGSVNALVRRPDGTLYGDNTDAAGFLALVEGICFSPAGKKALVLGSGGASVMVQTVLKELGAQAIAISRTGEDNYETLDRHADAALIVNATPVGMYPRCGAAPLELAAFPACECVLDLVYNPVRTALLMQAEELGIPHMGGLLMLVEQARHASELFTGADIDRGETARIEAALRRRLENIVLVGMPGSGKSTVAAILAERLGRPVYDSDALVEERAGMDIPRIFEQFGEARFRELESEAVAELGKASGTIISTGGGAVLREENYHHLHQNGTIVWLRRELDQLPTEGRPISLRGDLDKLYEQRRPRYERFADLAVDNDGTPEDAAERILALLEGQG